MNTDQALREENPALLGAGWQPDATQEQAWARLQDLAGALAAGHVPQGLWLYGPPGRGKSRLLELFMAQVAGSIDQPTRRVHFHAFVEELHKRLYVMPVGGDPLERLAQELAGEARVLGFDEFYLTNIADAMLLGRLMKLLFARGVTVVATSNWAMADLFQGGLNRDRFMPFLRLMEHHLVPVDLRDGPDWRQQVKPLDGEGHYLRVEQEKDLEEFFARAAGGLDAGELAGWPVGEGLVRRQGRAAWLTFKQACGVPRSRRDYARLVAHCDTLVLAGIPMMGPTDADATIRLVTLIDILYEGHYATLAQGGKRLIVSAAAAPAALCRVAAGQQGWPAAELFARTASRLVELTGGEPSRGPKLALPEPEPHN